MRRKNYLISFAAAAMLLALNSITSAQSGPLRGHVVMAQADGTKAPVEGAIIDVFRTDIGGHYETKTDKKGVFRFAGLPIAGTYTVTASAPNARPDALISIRVGTDTDYELTLQPGDGKRFTAAEAKALASGGSVGGGGGGGTSAPRKESAEERARREEMERKNAEIAAQNAKNQNINAVLNRTFKAGNDALVAKNWDEAIAQFKEGLAADPEQDALLVGLTEALRLRGADRYNAAVKMTDEAAKDAARKSAQQDWRDAAEAVNKAVEVIKKKPAPADPTAAANYKQNRYAALSARTKTMMLLIRYVDPTQADAGLAALQEYMEAETDAAKKSKAQKDFAKALLEAGAADKALAEYQKILDANPDDVDALAGAGMALFNLGYSSNDKAKFQEAANYLQRFVDKSPDGQLKTEAKAVLDEIKNQQNIKPDRSAPTRRRRQ
ncbi:MAG TPA: carboxypeptidase regulatory-like domain-containing protein [Pyrinomonadaceae bacterium]|jgi:tetratricopeptide (TPR) repeat protein